MGIGEKRLILIISNKWDVSIDYVIQELNRRNEKFVRLNSEDIPFTECLIEFPNFTYQIPIDHNTLNFAKNLRSILTSEEESDIGE